MRKLIIIVAVAFLAVPIADAQIFKIGLKAGLGLSNLKFDDLTGVGSGSDVYQLTTGDRVAAYHVGLQSRITIATFFIQPELYFNDGGGTINMINGGSDLLHVDLKTVDLPVLVGVKLGPARINVGPVGSYVLREETIPLEIDNAIKDYTIFTSGMSWGFQAGVGVDVSKISLDVRYEGSLSALGDSFIVSGQTFNLDARPRQWVFSLGFWFM